MENIDENYRDYYSANTLQVDKKTIGNGAYGTYDDGLLFRFPHDKYKHLTYLCRTSTEKLDTCNVKLFKLQDMEEAKLDKE